MARSGLARVGLVLLIGALFSMTSVAAAGPSIVPTSLGLHTHCKAGSYSIGIPGYDPVNQLIYVPNLGTTTGSISVLKAPCTNVATIHLPYHASPYAVAFDPANNKMYVADYSLNQIYVVSGTQVKHTIKLANCLPGAGVPDLVWDPAANLMLASDAACDTVVAISDNSIVGAPIPVGDYPWGIAYDPYANEILVGIVAGNNITGLDAGNPFVNAHLNITGFHAGFAPSEIAYDVVDHDDYVLGPLGLALVTGSGSILGTYYGLYAPSGLAWSPSKLLLYVTNSGGNDLLVFRGLKVTQEITGVGCYPGGLVYDDANDKMYVDSFSASVRTCSGPGAVFEL